MKYSADRDSAYFSKYCIKNIQGVFLDGKSCEHLCRFIDDTAGEALIHITDKDGKLIIDDNKEIVTKEVSGEFEVVFEEEWMREAHAKLTGQR